MVHSHGGTEVFTADDGLCAAPFALKGQPGL